MQLHHSNFIKSPISNVLENALLACNTIGDGLESYPLGNYILPSVLLNMTGFQEQKLKCICWDTATFDYDFRRDWLRDIGKFGEYSNYDSKNNVYKMLMMRIKKYGYGDNMSIFQNEQKKEIIENTLNTLDAILKESLFIKWKQKDYLYYEKWKQKIRPCHFANSSLLEECLMNVYNMLYKSRNMYAHNTISYQDNIPSFSILASPENDYNNFFCWFTLLFLLDKIFITLYETVIEKFELYV